MFLSPAAAQEGDLSDILRRLERLERENMELRAQVERLTARESAPSEAVVFPAERGGKSTSSAASGADDIAAAIDARLEEWKSERWDVGLQPNGGGFFLESPDDAFRLRLLGYAQAQVTATDGANGESYGEVDTRIRRARLDWIATLHRDYEVFIEIDGAPLGGTSLVEARLNAKIFDDVLQARLGKFTTPFSTENFLTSRSLETVERYLALNAMFSIPGLDVQTGGMLWGVLPYGVEREAGGKKFRPSLTYYAGIWNGNASAGNENPGGFGGNSRDNNNDKEYQAKLVLAPRPHWSFGLGYDRNTSESNEGLTLASLTGIPYIRTGVDGTRNGVGVDFRWEPGRFSLKGEGMYYDFKDAGLSLAGGYIQAGYFLKGDVGGGFQPVVRIDHARLNGSVLDGVDGDSITAAVAGFNWYLNGNARVQLNYVGEYFDGAGNASIGSDSFRSSVLGQFQIKF